ncbi:MAG TPA: GntR family transcriptional regulator [Burkholderiaceae bacterium]|jgi:DNA-binding GntR family transcriptional regulator|nr:GntR family transcriptional regulator [Burkholderiaceae bacterium]
MRRASPQEVAPIASPQSLTDRAYAELEEMIVTLQLAPGAAVSEAELSGHLGIGRTPIREALQRLARERLVIILPRRGVMVSEINVGRQLRLHEARREIERLIARTAARRATDEQRARFRELARDFEKSARANDDVTFMRTDRQFNLLCSNASHNEFAAGAMSLMHGLSRRFWYIHYKQAADMPLTAKLHADIARAIADKDEERAANASDRLLDVIEQFTRATVNPQ